MGFNLRFPSYNKLINLEISGFTGTSLLTMYGEILKADVSLASGSHFTISNLGYS